MNIVVALSVALAVGPWEVTQAQDPDVTRNESVIQTVLETTFFIPSQTSISPDGRYALISEARKSVRDGNTTYRTYLRNLSPEAPTEDILLSETLDRMTLRFKWHPDNKTLVWLDLSERNSSQLVAFDLRTGSRTPLMQWSPGDAGFPVADDFKFSSTGSFLAFTTVLAEAPQRPGVEGQVRLPNDVVGNGNRFGNLRRAVIVYEFSSRTFTQATPATTNVVHGFDWSPDERRLVVSSTSDTSGIPGLRADLSVVDWRTQQMTPIVARPGSERFPVWSPDGRHIAFSTMRGLVGQELSYPAVIDLRTEDIVEVGQEPLSDSYMAWVEGGDTLEFDAPHHFGRIRIRYGAYSGEVRHLDAFQGASELSKDTVLSLSSDGTVVLFERTDRITPPDLLVARQSNSGASALVRLTQYAEDYPLRGQVSLQQVSWKSQDNRFELNGLLLTPAEHRAGALPGLVYLTGGPSQVESGFASDGLNEAAVPLALRGYAVFIPVTRGRLGWSEEFTRSLREQQDYFGAPLSDALSGLDQLIEAGVIDGNRVGIYGHSYGASLTNYAVTTTNRFRAAASHEGGFNLWLEDLYGVAPGTDWWHVGRSLHGWTDPYDPAQLEQMMANSPAWNASRVHTPILLSWGQMSANTGHALKFFNALRRFDAPAVLFEYQGQLHTYMHPAAARMDLIRYGEWFDYWLLEKPYPDLDRALEYESWRREVTDTSPLH